MSLPRANADPEAARSEARGPGGRHRSRLGLWAVVLLVLLACNGMSPVPAVADEPPAHSKAAALKPFVVPATLEAEVARGELASAVFAGGCFWCMETAFEPVPGVVAAISGYTGGGTTPATYAQVSAGTTDHREAIRVLYDPKRVTYEQLLQVFWRNIDPTQTDGQFCDRGEQYRSAVFPATEAERAAAERTRAALKVPAGVVTEILPLEAFFPAENYHQDFYRKDPVRYQEYREACARDRRLQELWGPNAGH